MFSPVDLFVMQFKTNINQRIEETHRNDGDGAGTERGGSTYVQCLCFLFAVKEAAPLITTA